jgi:hypothetical protein
MYNKYKVKPLVVLPRLEASKRGVASRLYFGASTEPSMKEEHPFQLFNIKLVVRH